MATYFDKLGDPSAPLTRSFVDVPVTEDGVDTVAFLEASEGVVKLFDILGSAAFTVVQNDLTANITKVRDRYNAKPEASKTLEKLILDEKSEKKRTATEGLLWLLRGLQFTYKALQKSFNDKKQELSASFSESYDVTLKQFHNFVVKGIFSVAMKACPYRADFYKKLGSPPEKVDEQLKQWLDALESIVERLQGFYKAGGHDKGF